MLSLRLLGRRTQFLSLLFLSVPSMALAQGVTTAALSGVVLADDGQPVAGANIIASHVPSATVYRAVSTSAGTYYLPNLRIGGPYRLTATRLGFQPQVRDSVFLDLGQTLRQDFRLRRQAVQLAG